MDPLVYDGLLDVMDHRDSLSPLLSEKGSISNLLLLTTLNIIPLRKLASLKKLLVNLTYIWHKFKICITLSYLVKQTGITLKILAGGGGLVGGGGSASPPPPHTRIIR